MSFLIKPYTITSLRVDLYSEIFCYLVEDFTAGYEFADTLAQKLLGTAVPLKFVVNDVLSDDEYVGTFDGHLLKVTKTPEGSPHHLYYDGEADRYMFDDERIPSVWERGDLIAGVLVDRKAQMDALLRFTMDVVLPVRILPKMQPGVTFVNVIFVSRDVTVILHLLPTNTLAVGGVGKVNIYRPDEPNSPVRVGDGVEYIGRPCEVLYRSPYALIALDVF